MKPFMESLVANDSLRQRLCNDILGGSFSHAYIIEGPKGSGKHTIAYLTAAALSCEKKGDNTAPLPCMTCPSCRKILGHLSPDIITVGCEGRATMGVDSIRFLKEDVYLVPNDLENKIYIIEDADKMTPQAQNAFLLTLEEPPEYVGFMLLCENSLSLLETIRSRAPVLRTEPISTDRIDEYIRRVDIRAAQMKETAPSDYCELLMSANNGIGRALELLDTKALSPVLSTRKLIKDFVRVATSQASHYEVLELIPRFSSKRDALSDELAGINMALRDLIVIKKSENAPLCFYESRDIAIELCERVSISRLLTLMEKISLASDRIARNANVRLTLISILSESDMI